MIPKHHSLSFISPKIGGVVLIVSILAAFVLHVAFSLPLPSTIGLIAACALCVTFLRSPLHGFLTIVITRTSVDFMDSYFSLRLSESINLNIASLLGIMLIMMMLAIIIARFRLFIHSPLLTPFILFIALSGISMIYSIDRPESFQETVRVISIFSSFVLTYIFCITYPSARTTILSTIILSAFLPIIFAIYQLTTGSGFSDNIGTDGRLFGTFKHPNSFASFLMIIVALLTYRTFDPASPSITRNTKIFFLALIISLLILTFSRGGWLALILFFGFFTLLRAPKILFLFIVLMITLFFTSQTIHDRIEDVYNPPADSSIRWRFQQWHNAIAAWQLSPIYGYGAGTEIAIHEKEQGYYAGNPYTHNDMIKVLQELGVIGFASFTILLCATLIHLLDTYRHARSPGDRTFILIIILLFIAEIGFGMSSNIWRSTAVQWSLWMLIACALSLHKHETFRKSLL